MRYYIFDILLLFVQCHDELVNYAPHFYLEIMKSVLEEICRVIYNAVTIILKYSNNIDEIKQLWYEVEFFDILTPKFQNEKSIHYIKEIFGSLRAAKASIEGTEPLTTQVFTYEETGAKKILLIKTKYKF
mmetsp:Transcript_14785/g.12605  ORF Transcript_14785/g.12605 Transcript_14785/m.12605 type:complete len:130 (-) Transcript_14785:48-437(-)